MFQRNNDDGMAEDEDNEDGLMGNPQMQLNPINGAPIQFPPGLLNQANMNNMMMGNLQNIGVPGMGQFNPLAALAAVDLHQAAQEQLAQNNADAQQQQQQNQQQQQQDSDNDMV